MAGKIIADTIETGAGADISTSYVVNGSAKAWITYKGTSTNAIMDSLNMSGVVDNGTGDYTMSFTNNMSDGEYSLTDGAERLENNNSPSVTGFETTSSSSYIHNHWNSGMSVSDMFRTYSQATGDLA